MKDILIRAGKTFLQASIATLVLAFENGIDITSKDAITAIVVGAFSAGISAGMNVILAKLKEVK